MRKRFPAIAFLVFCGLSGRISGAAEKTVDFQRDVQPLIQKNCIGCHGPEQQMNSFRLDRRSAALRGGTRTVIVPGSSESSRLYLRLIGNQFGRRMPPPGALPAEEIAIFKAWIDQGAKWPDELANESKTTPPDPKAVRMIEALRTGNSAAFSKFVSDDPKSVNLRGTGGATPFMFAVLYSDAATVKKLLETGADANHRNDGNATALMWAATDLAKARLLLEHGAEVNARSTDGRTALTIAAVKDGAAPIVKLLLEHGADPNAAGGKPTDPRPLREAATAGDPETMKLLIEHGANIRTAGPEVLSASLIRKCSQCVDLVAKSFDARGYTRVLLDISVYPEPAAFKFVLDHGANVNTVDDEGRTPLLYAANSNKLPVEAVKLLIAAGANVNAKTEDGWTPLYLAKLHGNTPLVDLLAKSGARSEDDPAPTLQVARGNNIVAAVERSLPPIQRADLAFTKKSGCTSCHNEGLAQMTLGVVRRAGFHVDERMAANEVKAVETFWEEWNDRLLQGVAPGGPAYTLLGLNAMEYKGSLVTDAIAREIQMKQFADGHWTYGCGGSRAPLCGTQIANTAISMRALQLYAPPALKAEFERSIQRAADWLVEARSDENEDLVFRVFGLAWAGRKDALRQAMTQLVAAQRGDGGWSDIPSMNSTAYAAGEALMALHEAGMPVSDPAYQRGIKFLLSTQLEDGSWYIKTHSLAVQPYFDAGFPHGRDQWISASGTAWAAMTLAVSAQQSVEVPVKLAAKSPNR
jgi:ankyrin repeat protein